MTGKSRRFFNVFKVCLLSMVLLTTDIGHATPSWTKLARHVAQNERLHLIAVSELRKIKNLKQILLTALDTAEKPQALDVISALHLTNLIPELISKIPSDRDGFMTLTLNSLLETENSRKILTTYALNLRPESVPKFSAAALVAMLEPLGRLGVTLSDDTILHLFDHEYPEVRSAVLSYVRTQILQYKKNEYISLTTKPLHMKPFQFRLQAFFLLEEVSDLQRIKMPITEKELSELCASEANRFVKDQCEVVTAKLRKLK